MRQNYMIIRITLAAAFTLLCASGPVSAETKEVALRGVNLPGAASAPQVLPGKHGTNYLYPSREDVRMYADIGMNVIRLSFLWERLQPQLNEPFAGEELSHIDDLVRSARARGMTVVLDLHNYGSYRGRLIGSKEVPVASFADFWTRLAQHYKDEPLVAFGLMNEPNRQSAQEWAAIAQTAVTAIRKTGARQLILVPGANYSGAQRWLNKDGTLSNAEALAHLQDPAHHFAFELHQYFDADASGTHPTCITQDVGVKALSSATQWLRSTGNKGFLGEFGVSPDPVCLAVLDKTLGYMAANGDVWLGWTYWAASPWFGSYMFNIYPPDPARYPQVGVIKKFLPSRLDAEH
jgi:endoglucanase